MPRELCLERFQEARLTGAYTAGQANQLQMRLEREGYRSRRATSPIDGSPEKEGTVSAAVRAAPSPVCARAKASPPVGTGAATRSACTCAATRPTCTLPRWRACTRAPWRPSPPSHSSPTRGRVACLQDAAGSVHGSVEFDRASHVGSAISVNLNHKRPWSGVGKIEREPWTPGNAPELACHCAPP